MAKKNPQVAALMALASLVAFGDAGTVAPIASVKPLVDAGHAETAGEPDANGMVQVRATPAGVSANAGTAAPTTAATETVKPDFEIESGVERTKKAGRGRAGATKYPFEKLEVGQSFFVPGNDAAKSLASTVSSATKRYATVAEGTHKNRKGREVPNLTIVRKFEVETSTKEINGVATKGARVFRTK